MNFQDSCPPYPGGLEGPLAFGTPFPCFPALPRHASQPCTAQTKPAHGMFGFWTRQVFLFKFFMPGMSGKPACWCLVLFLALPRIFYPEFFIRLLIPKPRHTKGRSCRGVRRGGRAASSRTGCQQNCSPKNQYLLVPAKGSKRRCLNSSSEAPPREIVPKPNARTK